ncbi:type II toxin-antitoxin system RelE/ParE family toxin [Testudinibacter sp. P27/CKL/0425]
MIKSFKHKGLKQLFERGTGKGLNPAHYAKLLRMLDLIDKSTTVEDFCFFHKAHELKGDRKGIWSMTVSGNWRLTFEFRQGDAYILDYEDYH